MKDTFYRHKTAQLILIATLLRLLTAGCVELGNDEVYYRIYASSLQWNYFDHPPMVGWLIRLSTFNLLFDNAVFIRVGAILSAAAATWLIFLSGKKINDAYTGFLAALLYSSCLYTSIISGIFILPDSPQMVCWTGALLLLLRITRSQSINRSRKKAMLLFGCITGLGMLCKIHSSFLWLGLGAYILLYNRRWLSQPSLYIAGLTTLLFFYPVIRWNIDNGFVTYFYHSSRVNVSEGGMDLSNLLRFSAGQFFYFNPVLFIFFIPAVAAALKNRLPISVLHKRILLLTALPLIGISFCIACFKEVLPHWSGPSCCSLVLLAAAYFRKHSHYPRSSLFPFPLKLATAVCAVIITGGVLLINFYPGTLSARPEQTLGEGDFTLDMYGWKSLRYEFEKIADEDTRSGRMKPNSFIISNKWFPAAHIEHYVAGPLHRPFTVLGDLPDIHQYAWLNKTRDSLHAGDDAWCIVPSNNWTDPLSLYGHRFETVTPGDTITQKRSGKISRYFYVYQLKNFRPGR